MCKYIVLDLNSYYIVKFNMFYLYNQKNNCKWQYIILKVSNIQYTKTRTKKFQLSEKYIFTTKMFYILLLELFVP